MISIVIPVHNEQETLPELYARVSSTAEQWLCDYEVIVVNDGSHDATGKMLADIHRDDLRWKVLTFSRNFGHQAAISAGLSYSRGDAVAIIDGDLQDPPEVIEKLLQKWKEGYQVVYAVRCARKENLLLRCCYSLFYRVLRRVASVDIPLDSGDFCVMDRSVVNVLNSLPERTRFVRGLRSWAGFRQAGVEYERHARFAGEPKYTLSKLVQLACNGVLSFSNAPLRLASWLGIALCGMSCLLVVAVVIWWACDVRLFGMAPRDSVGWTSMMSMLLLLSGLQMLMIGVVGAYLARVFEEVKGRPAWVVASDLGFHDQEIIPAPGAFPHKPDTQESIDDFRRETTSGTLV